MSLNIVHRLFRCVRHRLGEPAFYLIARWTCAITLLFLCMDAWADGSDLLQGTDASAWATLTGTGKKYIYMIEFVLAIASYMTTRKLIVFTGFIVVSVVINMVLHFAGQS